MTNKIIDILIQAGFKKINERKYVKYDEAGKRVDCFILIKNGTLCFRPPRFIRYDAELLIKTLYSA